MTRDKDFKRLVRSRMAKTGERYSAARAHLIRQTPATEFGGINAETAALRSLLSEAGIGDPTTGEPFAEAALLGLGGGIGAAYYVFEYAGGPPHLYIETRVGPQYPYDAGFISRITEGLGVETETRETGGKKAAATNLANALERGRSALVWVDMTSLPYYHLGDSQGALPHVVTVARADEQTAEIYDLSSQPFVIATSELAEARARLRKAKNRVFSITGGGIGSASLGPAIEAGLKYCVQALDGTTGAKGYASNMGLAGIEKWAALVDNDKDKKGWPKTFRPGRALTMGLRQGYFWIEAAGTGGGGFRSMYADFLEWAAPIVDRPALAGVAESYRELAASWSALADRMLPDDDTFGPLRAATHEIEDANRRGNGEHIAAARADLEAQTARLDECPLDSTGVAALYADLKAQLDEIAVAERAARDLLAAALD